MDDKLIRYAIYARKSTESEERQTQSIKSQLYELDEVVRRDGLNVVQVITEEKSGKIPFKREKFTEMIREVERGNINGILVWETSRLSRNPTESGMLQQLLQDGKLTRIRSMTRKFETDDNAVIFGVESAVATQYSIDGTRRAIRGYRKKVRDGQLSGRAPEGYINNTTLKTIEKDPLRFNIIRKIFDMYLTGDYTVIQIKEYLDETGYLTIKRLHSGNKPLSRSGIYKILSNPRYYGMIPHPDYPDDASKMYKAAYPKMITRDEFERIQYLLGSKGRTKYVTKKHFQLKGLMSCGECGCSITAEYKSKKLANGGMNFYTYYHCTHKKKSCSQRGVVSEEVLFDQIEKYFAAYEIPDELYKWGLNYIDMIAKTELEERKSTKTMQNMSASLIEKKLDTLLDKLTDEIISNEEYLRKSTELKADLQNSKNEIQLTQDRVRNRYEIIGKTFELLNGVSTNFRNGDVELRKEMLNAIGYNHSLKDKTLSFTPYEWLEPMKNKLPEVKIELEKVITDEIKSPQSNEPTKKDFEKSLMSSWQGYVESNHGFRFWRPTH